MKNSAELKDIVRNKYSEIALQPARMTRSDGDKSQNTTSCCGSGCCSSEVENIMTDDYSSMEGYVPEADLGLGCGLPTQFAKIKKGDTVIDLGSGAGNDCFIARRETGTNGKVLGVDFTPAMIEKARENANKLGFNNVEFRLGDIENLPVEENFADVVVSNCVLNLVPGKELAIREIFRVLKPGGHFSISDIVLEGSLPENILEASEMYAGCVSGAIQKNKYLDYIREAGFSNISIQKEKKIFIPDDILVAYMSETQIEEFRKSNSGIVSITVYAEKPCCDPVNKCC
jgi:ubiquinone/menaquinone biosynthesis C-methylase UbiE